MSDIEDKLEAVPNRNEIQELVEENWRQFLTFSSQGSKELAEQIIQRFDEKNQVRAARMSGGQGDSFLAMIEDERDKIFDEYSRSPHALKARLGIVDTGPINTPAVGARQGLGELVVKTAVRASIWALIWDLLR